MTITQRATCVALALLAITAVAHAEFVRVVDAAGGTGSQFTSLSHAVSVVPEGTILLVRPGAYDGFVIDDLGLTIVAEDGGVSVDASEVRNLSAGKQVTLRGLELGVAPLPAEPSVPLFVADCVGSVLLEDCVVKSQQLFFPVTGVLVEACADVALVRCDVAPLSTTPGDSPRPHGVLARESQLALWDCVVTGGTSANVRGDDSPHQGGAGVHAVGGSVFVSACDLTGGKGGSSVSVSCAWGGTGGPGLELEGGAVGRVLQSSFTGGPGGDGRAPCGDGPQGPPIDSFHGTLETLTGAAPQLAVSAPVREFAAGDLALDGPAGELVVLLSSFEAVHEFVPAWRGVLVAGAPQTAAVLGSVPPGGQLEAGFSVPGLGPGVQGLTVLAQAATVGAGSIALSSPSRVVLVDSMF